MRSKRNQRKRERYHTRPDKAGIREMKEESLKSVGFSNQLRVEIRMCKIQYGMPGRM